MVAASFRRRQVALLLGIVGALASCPDETPPPAPVAWSPGSQLPSSHEVRRGLIDLRGLIHAHSYYSHDACDESPVDEAGVRNAVCLDDFRRGLCQSRHDFVMLTDHDDSFEENEFPDVLLHFPERGDTLINHVVDGEERPTANRTVCDDGTVQFIMAGSESGLMPVGLDRHVEIDGVRSYGSLDQTYADAIHDAGGLVMLAHPEDFSIEELKALPVDGFEMYNLHRNTVAQAGVALELLVRLQESDPGLPHPDLVLAPIFQEDPLYLERWGRVLASGLKRTTTMGTDCHRNTFNRAMQDGERVDSYRRMMSGFSNHLLVRADAFDDIDDRGLKDALGAGRLYGAFDFLGQPLGFDFHATAGDVVTEMGETAAVGSTLEAQLPSFRDLAADVEAPFLTLRILRAVDDDAGWEVVASLDSDDGSRRLSVAVTEPGAYRAEVRMVPLHLRADLGRDADILLADGRDFVWIYSNALYVR